MKGSCLCGAVTITAPELSTIEACHCGTCRRWGGGPFMTVHGGPGVQIDGRDKVTAYRSSDWAQRGFCAECGTHLYYYLIPAKDYILSAGLFEESRSYAFNKQIFVDKKPGNYAFANDTEQLTEAQVFAKHK
jgi:hypothetical protein